jgi:hypothetical protein
MTEVTSASPGAELLPEDATTLEEFQVRRDAELAQLGGAGSRWGDGWRAALIVVVAGIDAVCWYRVTQATGIGWHVLGHSLVFLGVLARASTRLAQRIMGRAERRRELERLGAEWQAKADRSEMAG